LATCSKVPTTNKQYINFAQQPITIIQPRRKRPEKQIREYNDTVRIYNTIKTFLTHQINIAPEKHTTRLRQPYSEIQRSGRKKLRTKLQTNGEYAHYKTDGWPGSLGEIPKNSQTQKKNMTRNQCGSTTGSLKKNNTSKRIPPTK